MERVRADAKAQELQSALSLLVAVSRALSQVLEIDQALSRALDVICRGTGWVVGHAYLVTTSGELRPGDVWWTEDERYEAFRDATMQTWLHQGEGLPGRAYAYGRAVWMADLRRSLVPARASVAEECGLRGGLGIPVMQDGVLVAVLEFFSRVSDEPAPVLIEVVDAAALSLGRVWARQRDQAELARSEARFRAVAQSANDGIVSADASGRITFCNEATARMFGVPADDLVGRDLTTLMPERYRAAHLAAFQRFLLTGDPQVIGRIVQVEAVRADGSEFPVELSLGTGTSPDGQLFAGVIRDTTERRRAEEEAQRSRSREQEADEALRSIEEMKARFLTAVSHEMRTPLASVLGIALTLDRKPDLPEEARTELVGQLARNASRLDTLLRDLLDVEGLTRGSVHLTYASVDLGELARAVVARSAVDDRRVTVLVDDEPLVAVVDGQSLERVLEHLLSNVDRHTPMDSSVWVHVRATEQGVLLGVDDDGPGVPEAMRGKIFEPFQQGPALHPHSPGTGVGLSLVSRIAALHGGRAWVDERPGGGAAFRVLVRAAPQDRSRR